MLAALLAIALAGTAVAAPAIGKDGRISACYRAKGKAKGAMRVVPAGKKCRRGERKLAWSVAGVPGPRGENGAPGERGQKGAAGANGANGGPGPTVAALEGRVAALEDILDGVQKGDLSGVVGKLSGITGVKLNEAVDALPVLSALTPKVEGVEDLLEGVAAGDLEAALDKLNGVSQQELAEAVASLPELTTLTDALPTLEGSLTTLTSKVGGVEGLLTGVGAGDLAKVKSNVGLLCTQTGAVTDQVNSVGTVLNNLLGGLLGIPLVGNILGGEKAPDPLLKVSCTA